MLFRTNAETNISNVWIWLTLALYILFTLLPDSHSLMVQWPWVAIWQIALFCPIFWLLSSLWHQGKLASLGNGLDWILGMVGLGVIISTLGAEFPFQARWYAWASLCMIAAIYALNQWLTIPGQVSNSTRRYQLLIKQGYLNLAFIIISLSLWITQTLLPELIRLNSLKQFGANLGFDFSILELRNWSPIGHQNYVAGYLVLTIPLLIGLAILQKGWQRWLWSGGVVLGILALYTTSSRGGWLGLIGFCIFGLGVLYKSRLSRLSLGLGGLGTVFLLILLILSNNRLRTVLISPLQGKGGGEFAYRFINAAIGWQMGNQHPLTGIGLGNVPLAYQKYRPIWAGRESELIYQLHSTPVQLWAEMGIWGILPLVGVVAFLVCGLIRYASPQEETDKILLWSLYGGLLAYGLMSLTDYQLDNLSISGTLIIYFACLASLFKSQQHPQKGLFLVHPSWFFAGLGIVITMVIWLIPIHRAWQLSNQGFLALNEDRIDIFTKYLTKAEQLAPWEPYYSYQLGWNLGNLALKSPNPQQKQQLLSEGIKRFELGNKVSPYQEFGHSNLGWLLLYQHSPNASQAFLQSVGLIPAKKGVFYGLGLSLLSQKKIDLAIEAFALESIRDPMFITSPIWRIANLQPIYQQVIRQIIINYETLLQTTSQKSLANYFHQSRGGLYWWIGDLEKAHADWDTQGNQLSQQILALEAGKNPQLSDASVNLLLQAWNNPSQQETLLKQAWIQETQTELPQETAQELLKSIKRSTSFSQWIKQNAPLWQYRRQREGFGVISRHIDGTQPLDFLPVIENSVMTTWFSELLPSPDYFPELDLTLKPLWDRLVEKVDAT